MPARKTASSDANRGLCASFAAGSRDGVPCGPWRQACEKGQKPLQFPRVRGVPLTRGHTQRRFAAVARRFRARPGRQLRCCLCPADTTFLTTYNRDVHPAIGATTGPACRLSSDASNVCCVASEIPAQHRGENRSTGITGIPSTMDSGNAPGSQQPGPAGRLSECVYVPIQPPNVSQPWQAVVSGATKCHGRAACPLQENHPRNPRQTGTSTPTTGEQELRGSPADAVFAAKKL